MLQEFLQLFSTLKTPSVNSDTLAFKLIYRLLCWTLIGFFLLVVFFTKTSGKMYCLTDDPRHSSYAAEYCSSQGVYLFDDMSEEKAIEGKSLFPGIRPQTERKPVKMWSFFYTYSAIYFLMMAASCYVGRLFWSKTQGPLLLDIIGNLKRRKTSRATERTPEQITQDIEEAGRILFESLGQHRYFFMKYIAAEVVNCVILVAQLVIMSSIGGWSLWWNGIKIFYYINKPYAEWPLEVAKNFPLVAKCDVRHYGHGGNEVLRDALCFLHYNNTVQLLFVIHWLLVCILLIVCLITTYTNFRKLSNQRIWVKELTSILYKTDQSQLVFFLERLTPGTSFVISLLCKNLSPHVVCRILFNLRMELNARSLASVMSGFP